MLSLKEFLYRCWESGAELIFLRRTASLWGDLANTPGKGSTDGARREGIPRRGASEPGELPGAHVRLSSDFDFPLEPLFCSASSLCSCAIANCLMLTEVGDRTALCLSMDLPFSFGFSTCTPHFFFAQLSPASTVPFTSFPSPRLRLTVQVTLPIYMPPCALSDVWFQHHKFGLP